MSMEKEVSTLRTVHAPAFVCPEAPEAFEKLKEHTREAVLDLLGRPPFSEPPALNPKILSETDAGGYLRKKVRYGNESDDVVWAWLLVPKGLTRPAPAILCFPGTFMTPNWGKDAPAGLAGPENSGDPEAYGADLAELGYIALCPDYPCAGERTAPGLKSHDTTVFDRRFPTWSRMGMSVWDVSRAVDFLLTVPEVDGKRIGCTGWSQGGVTTLLGAAMDPRIAVAVAVCGWSPFRGYDLSGLMASYNYPRLRPYVAQRRPLPFDMDQVAAMIAPRPFLNLNAKLDRFFPNKEELTAAEEELARLYAWHGAEDRFRAVGFEGDHAHGRVAVRASQAWFDRWLRESDC